MIPQRAIGGCLVAVALAGTLACAPERPAQTSAGQPLAGPIEANGLGAPVRIVTDRYGIPHLQASSLEDLHLAWGFVTARDRLWQIEYSRLAARGELWRSFGNRKLRDDGGAQLFELAERASRIWERERSRPEVVEALEAYARGINLYLDLCRDGRQPWPRELAVLGLEPAPWRPEDSVLMLLAQGVVLDLVIPEIEEGRLIREHGREWLDARDRFEEELMHITIPDSAAVRLYGSGSPRAARDSSSATRAGRSGARPAAISAALARRARNNLGSWLSAATHDPDVRASNVFAAGGGRGAHGKPLLANDPHLALSAPGPFHVVHLTVPGQIDAIGAAVPGLPTVVSGRNRACAWGITALSADVIDVYADTLSADGTRVRSNGAWVPLVRKPFTMRYRLPGGATIPVPGQVRRYTPHGPVLAVDKKTRVALVARWAGDDQDITLTRLLGLALSRSAEELAERARTLITPGLNVVAADTAGGVVYQAAGALPRRGFEPGLGPLAADGRHEWQGLIAPDQLPHWRAPTDGYVVNANNLPVGSAYPEPLPRYDWAHDRAARIAALLAADSMITTLDLAAIQNDVFSRGAERFVPRLLRCADSLADILSPRARQALDSLRAWDFQARRARIGPTIYRGWYGALQRRSRLDNLSGLTAAALDGRAPEALAIPGRSDRERPAAAAVKALELALDELARKLGPEFTRWSWDRAHQALFAHPLSWKQADLRPAPVPADGDNSTPCVGRSGLPWSTTFTHGATFRHVVDLGVPDSSIGVVPPGNSGDPASGHTLDHLALWANHEYVPFLMAWDRIEQARENEILLTPAGSSPRGDANP